MAGNSVETSVKGKWIKVPALQVNGKTIIVRGRWIKVGLVHDEDWLETELEDPELCAKMLKEQGCHGVLADILTFSQKLPAIIPKFNYPMEWDSVAAVRTTSFKDWWEKLPQETRKNVRRSQKRGVVVSIKNFDDDLAREITSVNNDSPLRQQVPFWHYGKTVDQVRKDQSSFLDRSEFICAYYCRELIGFLKLVYRGEIASILQFLPKASHQDKRPANALIAKAIELCEAKGLLYLTYGNFIYGNKRDTSLLEFKIRNGFEEILVPRFYVPLTRKGALALELKLHRGLIGILPESAIRILLSARAIFYRLKTSMGRCSSMAERPNL